jgi:DNA-binding transcriptional regulator YiaG
MARSDIAALAQVRTLMRTGAARSLRTSKNVSLSEVAAAAHIAKSTLSRWERGERTPHGAPAIRYLRVLQDLMGQT